MTNGSEFWDLLAPHHAALEDSYLDLRSIRQIAGELEAPVLVVGAGQGLIVAELKSRGLVCDGIDLSPEMIRYAKSRRGISLIEANARSMPFGDARYRTILYATGVLDFMTDEGEIATILKEGRRVVHSSGKMFAAFYKVSRALEEFMTRLGLLRDGVVEFRQSLESYLLNPAQMVTWVAERASVSRWAALGVLLRMSMLSTWHEKAITFRMQKFCKDKDFARAFINAAPERQPYRNEAAIRALFQRLGISVRTLRMTHSCYLVQLSS